MNFGEMAEQMHALSVEQKFDDAVPVRIIDEEGFVHETAFVTFDTSDGCVYINTRWRR